MYEYDKTLVASTGHITCHDKEVLEDGLKELILLSWEYGWIIYLDEDWIDENLIESNRLSMDFVNLMALALKEGCQWLRLDCDGPTYENLPTHEW